MSPYGFYSDYKIEGTHQNSIHLNHSHLSLAVSLHCECIKHFLSPLFLFWRALMSLVATYSTHPLLLWAWLINFISVRITTDHNSPVMQPKEVVWNITQHYSFLSFFWSSQNGVSLITHSFTHFFALLLVLLYSICLVVRGKKIWHPASTQLFAPQKL